MEIGKNLANTQQTTCRHWQAVSGHRCRLSANQSRSWLTSRGLWAIKGLEKQTGTNKETEDEIGRGGRRGERGRRQGEKRGREEKCCGRIKFPTVFLRNIG